MIYTLDNIKQDFVKSLDEILKFIDLINLTKSQDISFARKSKFYSEINNSINDIKEKINNTKDIQYNAIIISLYGAFELAIKESTKAFIKFCINNNFPLANKLSKDYILSVAKSFERNSINESKNNIKDLNLFLNENDLSKFNPELTLLNYQNLRTDIVQKIANSIEINNVLNEAKDLEEFRQYIMEREGLSSIEQAILYIDRVTNPFQYIDELVHNRNFIAHRGRAETRYDFRTIEGSIIRELKILVFYYIKRLQETWYYNCVNNNTDIKELEVLDIFDNSIICFNTHDTIIDKKSIILIKNGKNKIQIANINSIQYNRNNIETSENNQDISCYLNKVCKKTFKYFLYKPKAR